MSGSHLSPAQIHAKLSHPIIDGDGHRIEYTISAISLPPGMRWPRACSWAA